MISVPGSLACTDFACTLNRILPVACRHRDANIGRAPCSGIPLLSALLTCALLPGLVHGCNGPDVRTEWGESVDEDAPLHEVTIHQPDSLTGLRASTTGPDGNPVSLRCATCHDGSPGADLARRRVEGDRMHAGLTMEHGELQCASCHSGDSLDQLHLASGEPVELVDAFTLCAQCHGPQTRDYNAGSHGGMNGYWDLRRGPRVRNHCIDCHDPHQPRYPDLVPMPAPRDRFLHRGRSDSAHGTHSEPTPSSNDGHSTDGGNR